MSNDVIDDAKREVDEAIAAATDQAGKPVVVEGAAKPEAKPEGGAKGADPEGEAKPEGVAEAKPEGGDGPKPEGQPEAVPYKRFAKVYRTARDLELENAQLKGKVEVLEKGGGKPAATPEDQATKDPEVLIAGIDKEIDALAEKFDAGEIKLAEFKRRERELEAQKSEIRQASVQPEPVRDLALEERTQELEGRFPFLAEVSQEHLDAFAPMAIQLMKQRRIPVDDTPAGQLAFRQHLVATAIAHNVPAIYGWTKKEDGSWEKAGAKPKPAMPGAPAKPPARTGVTPEQRQAKADLAAAQPPSPDLGRPAAAQVDPTEADVSRMSDEEIAALPAATRDRLAKRA